jgi:TolB-like protein
MEPSPGRYDLALLGPFRLTGPDGRRIDITSRRGMALVAMLALSRDGERTRAWLQERLWGSRGDTQAQGSLRTELSDLRKRLNVAGPPLLSAGHERVRLDLSRLDIDVRGPEPEAPVGELLEGLEIPGEEGFESWLIQEREAREHARERARAGLPRARPSGTPAEDRASHVLAPAAQEWGRPRLLAVLAFDNLSNDPEMDYFSNGVSEDIQIAVCRAGGLNVIGRASSFQLRGAERTPENVAASLGATHLLDGSVRRSGDRVRITASLVDCASRSTVWSERYDRKLAEVFEVQDDIAGAVANALQAVFTPQGLAQKIDAEAYDAYLRAHALAGHPDENRQCRALLEAAVAGAPDFAAAWASLAMARALHLVHDLQDRNADARAMARREVFDAAERATALDPSLGLPFVALSHLEPPAAWARQEALLEQARRVSPEDLEVLKHSADFIGNVGRMRDNFALVGRAHRADPLNRTSAMNYCVALADVGFLDESYEAFHAAQARWPDSDNLVAVPILHSVLLQDGRRLEQFLAAARRFITARGETRALRIALTTAQVAQNPTDAARALMLASAERHLAQSGHVELRTVLFAYWAGLRDEAFDWIARSDYSPLFQPEGRRADDTFLPSVIFGATNAAIRRDRRFPELCAKLGLCDYWLASGRWPDCADELAGVYDFRARAAAAVAASKR